MLYISVYITFIRSNARALSARHIPPPSAIFPGIASDWMKACRYPSSLLYDLDCFAMT